MKIYKKVGIGLSLVFIVLAGLMTFHRSPVYAAASQDDALSCFKSLSFIDIAHITCTVPGQSNIVFTDSNPSDPTTDYLLTSPVGLFCNSSPSVKNVYRAGGEGSQKLKVSDAGKEISANVDFGYVDPGKTGCNSFPIDKNGNLIGGKSVRDVANSNAIAIILKGGDNSVTSLDGVTGGDLAKNYTRYPGSDPPSGSVLYAEAFNSSCSGSILAVDPTGKIGHEYTLTAKGGKALSEYDDLKKIPASQCGITNTNFGLDGDSFTISPAVKIDAAAAANTCTNGFQNPPSCNACSDTTTQLPCASAGASGDTLQTPDDVCVGTGFALAFVMCPTLEAADSLATAVTGTFEDQLSFTIGDLGKSNQDGVNKTQTAWALIRDISSGILVIVMLVMIVSQAIGGGPFDAYTVRKLLPKLVVAVILMQLSWTILAYVVSVVNDIGNGLKDILYLPFRPANLDDFWQLLSNAGIGTGGAAVASWTGLVGVAIGVSVALPTLLMFCFIAVAAVLTGLAVLIFRKILIIMALMLAPLALVAWILPGTQKYFKLWYDNFLKALFMFPVAIAIIAAGRIFAYVSGTQGNGKFINFFLVTIGFFGPLFILPKTFKWGGSLMQSVGNAAGKVNSKLSESPKKYFQARQESLSHERKLQAQKRFADPELYDKNKIASLWRKPLDRFHAGQYDPLMYGERRDKATTRFKQEGEESDRKEVEAKELALKEDWQQMEESGEVEIDGTMRTRGTKDDFLQSIAEQRALYDDNGLEKVYMTHDGRQIDWRKYDTEIDQRGALLGMAKLRGGTNLRHIAAMYRATKKGAHFGEVNYNTMRRFLNQNLDPLLQQMTLEYKGFDSTADAGPNGVASHHGTNVENMLAEGYETINKEKKKLSDVKRSRDAGTATNEDVAAQQGRLDGKVRSFNRYISSAIEGMLNDNLRGQFEQGNTRAFLAALTTDEGLRRKLISEINNPNDEDGRMNPALVQVTGADGEVTRGGLVPMAGLLYNDDGKVTGIDPEYEQFLREHVDTQSPAVRETIGMLVPEKGGAGKVTQEQLVQAREQWSERTGLTVDGNGQVVRAGTSEGTVVSGSGASAGAGATGSGAGNGGGSATPAPAAGSAAARAAGGPAVATPATAATPAAGTAPGAGTTQPGTVFRPTDEPQAVTINLHPDTLDALSNATAQGVRRALREDRLHQSGQTQTPGVIDPNTGRPFQRPGNEDEDNNPTGT